MQTDVQEFTVRDQLGELTLRGRILADCRWGRSDKPRWTDMVLYGVVDPESEFKYALETIARSFVYHRVGGPCVRAGHPIRMIDEVKQSEHRWRWLVPCTRHGCRPPDLEKMRPSDRIAEEKDRHHLYLCKDPKDILRRLYKEKGEISGLAAKLLHMAAENDPEIATAWRDAPRRV